MCDDELFMLARRKNLNLVAIDRIKKMDVLNEKCVEKFKLKTSIVIVNN